LSNNPLLSRFNFVALDIETTGLNSAADDIIEIGAVRYRNGLETESFSKFLRPSKPVPTFIKQLTHITETDLIGAESQPDALAALLDFIEDDILVFHNHDFDFRFINASLERHHLNPMRNGVLDTLELTRIYLPFTPGHKLGMMAARFGIVLDNAHRAIHDARATGELFCRLVNWICENIPLPVNHTLSEVAIMADTGTILPHFLRELTAHLRVTALLKPNPPKPFEVPLHEIEHEPDFTSRPSMADVFGEEGILAQKFPGFEHREGQLHMAEGVAEALSDGHHLLCEAGTGVGKSLAYLVPAIEYSRANHKRVVISTNTKNLQEQLFNKDLPTVRECVDIPFRAVILKGRDNYLCPHKWDEVAFDLRALSPAEAEAMLYLLVWKEYTRTGDISENSSFQRSNFSTLWKKLAADRYFCPGRRCTSARKCFLLYIRQKAEEANLVIVNHSLLLSDRMADNNTIGAYDALVVDEAHNLPEAAARHFGTTIGYPDLSGFLSQLYQQKKSFTAGQLLRFQDAVARSMIPDSVKTFLEQKSGEAIRAIDDGRTKFGEFFRHIGEAVSKPDLYGKLRIRAKDDAPYLESGVDELIDVLRGLLSTLTSLHDTLSDQSSDRFVKHEEHLGNLDGAIGRTMEFIESLGAFIEPDFRENAVWFSNFLSGESDYPNGLLNLAPLETGRLLRSKLYPGIRAVVFTSATLALRGKFKFFATRLGLDADSAPEQEDPPLPRVEEAVYPSPFDYPRQSLVLGASYLPEPNDPYFQSQMAKLIQAAVETTRVGTLALFTSYKDLNAVYDAVADSFFAQDITLLAQGKGLSRSVILNEFRDLGSSVLFGTSSFWEGIDVQGESLSLLIVTKLPFQVPSDPVVEAYLEKLKNEGKDSFMHYTLPNALLKFRQGFGRLIRSKSDMGVALVLDNRIFTKYYGRYFQEILPTRIVSAANPVELTGRMAKWFHGKGASRS
jgi:ATP-dependent DNA helicase DinG